MINKFLENSKEDLRMVRKHSLVWLDSPDILKEKHGVSSMEKLTTKISGRKISGISALWSLKRAVCGKTYKENWIERRAFNLLTMIFKI